MSDSPAHLGFKAANAKYVEDFDSGDLLPPPVKRLIIITCMDARIEPLASVGLKIGDAHVLRNAGGYAKKAFEDAVLSLKKLNTREIAVFHHTDCSGRSDDAVEDINSIDFVRFKDLDGSVRDDVTFLKTSLVGIEGIPAEIIITGWVYDVKTGGIKQVV